MEIGPLHQSGASYAAETACSMENAWLMPGGRLDSPSAPCLASHPSLFGLHYTLLPNTVTASD